MSQIGLRGRGLFVRLVAGVLSLLWLAAWQARGVACAGATPSANEQVLRARVEQLYAALQAGDWAKVESCLTEQSKEIFRQQPKRGIQGFEIQSIKVDPDGQTATVVVQIPVFAPNSLGPAPVTKTTRWRLINQVWYAELPKADPHLMQSLYGPSPKSAFSVAPLALSKDLKFQSTWCGLGEVHWDQPRVARFPFKNVGSHVVTLAEVQLGCDCLRMKTGQKEFKPGESATLEFELDPSGMQVKVSMGFTQTILLKTEPGDAYVRLTVSAMLVPGNTHPDQP